MAKNRILILDDEESILSAYKRILRSFINEWVIDFESNSRLALDRLNEYNYDVLLTDVSMPGLDGIGLLKELKSNENTKHIEVIVVTGLDDLNLKKVALESGATDLLTKPVSSDELVARLKNTLELKKTRDDLLKQNSDLRNQLALTQKMELIGILAGGAVHDLNNILGVIKGYGQLMQFSKNVDDKVSQGLDTILNSVDRAAAITKQIHSFTRSGGDEEEVVVQDLLRDIKEILGSSIGKRTEIELVVPEFSLIRIHVNSTYLYQVVMNLAINAVQAMNGEGRLIISLKEDARNIILNFQDFGPGMSEDIQKRVFEPMFTTKKETGGSGLGLSIVKQIIDELNGRIDLHSKLGEGTVFSVNLPK